MITVTTDLYFSTPKTKYPYIGKAGGCTILWTAENKGFLLDDVVGFFPIGCPCSNEEVSRRISGSITLTQD